MSRTQYRILRKDESVCWIALSMTYVLIDENQCVLCFFEDITAEKENFAQMKLVADSIGSSICVKRIKNGQEQFIYANESFFKMIGTDKDAYIEKMREYDMAFASEEDIKQIQDTLAMALSTGEPQERMYQLRRDGADPMWMKHRLITMQQDEADTYLMVSVTTDITEKKREEWEKRLVMDSLLNELPGGVAVFKIGERVECQYFNDGLAQLSGWTRNELEKAITNSRSMEGAVAQSDLPYILTKIREVAPTGEQINLTYRFLTKDGELRWLHVNGSKLREEDGCPVYYCVFTKPSEETALYRSIVEDSAGGVIIAERVSRRIVYCNRKLREFCKIDKDVQIVGKLIFEVIPKNQVLLEREEIDALPSDHYVEYHRSYDDVYLAVRTKALVWNGVESYIIYVSDETNEHKKAMQHQNLLNQVPMGIGIYEIDHGRLKQLYMNDSYYRMIGMSREECHKESHGDFLDFTHQDDIETIYSAMESCLEGSEEESFDHRIICGDGKYHWFRLDASVAGRENERVTIYCSYANIDATIKAQEDLKKANLEINKQYRQERLQRKMLEKDSMIALRFNVTQDKLISYQVNQNLVSEFEKETAGSIIRSVIPDSIPTDEERRAALDFFDRKKAFIRFQNGTKEFGTVYRRRLNDGRLYWMRTTCRLERDEENGDIISYTYFRNVDLERKKELATESVIGDETDFIVVLNIITDKAILLQLGNDYIESHGYLNKEFSFDLAKTSEIMKIVVPDDKNIASDFFSKEALVNALCKTRETSVDYRCCGPDNEVRRKKTRAYYLDDTKEDIVITCRDITDLYQEEQEQKQILRKALDEAHEANNAKSDFLSRMSHDLRTPMNVIIGLTSLAMDSEDKSEAMDKMLSDITDSAKYLLSLINDCLDMEKITSGKIELHPEAYPYVDFYNSVRAVIGPLCRQKDIELVIDAKDAIYYTIFADKIRMEQLFYNLLSNAAKFTPPGGKVEVHIENTVIKDGRVSFDGIVADNGIGMSEEFQSHMFEAFTQENHSITSEHQGSGLGLSIVKEIADLMDAAITVKSELGKGTEFRIHFTFPIVEKMIEKKEESDHISLNGLRGKKVLLAEDHPLNAMIAVKFLEKEGMTVITAENGKVALDKFSSVTEGYFDVILMDIRMPVMNGIDAAEAIRKLDRPDAKTVPIIAMTANVFDTDVQASLHAGMNAHLSKPIEVHDLYETLVRHIK
ncbi:MAG: PAS domain-containing protein [Eubacteriaceae bacterium]|nr:PAS domain-containing protein [Eubacteriaceae bacterium]